MEYKWRYVCTECHNVQNYKMNMNKRYKCKQCSNRSAIVSEWKPAPAVGVFASYFCPDCKEFKDFKCDEHFKVCPTCGYSTQRIEYEYSERIDLNESVL